MGELPTLGKLGGFWKEGGKEEKGKGEGKRGGKGKERQGKRAKGEEGKLGEEENLKWMGKGMKGMDGERYEKKQRTFSFFFSFFFACHFLKPLKFVWGVPKWKFLRKKKSGNGKFSNLAHLGTRPWTAHLVMPLRLDHKIHHYMVYNCHVLPCKGQQMAFQVQQPFKFHLSNYFKNWYITKRLNINPLIN